METVKILRDHIESLWEWIKDLQELNARHGESAERAWNEVIRLRTENAALWQRLQERRPRREMSAELRLARVVGHFPCPPGA